MKKYKLVIWSYSTCQVQERPKLWIFINKSNFTVAFDSATNCISDVPLGNKESREKILPKIDMAIPMRKVTSKDPPIRHL